jgi:protein gp37
MMGSKTGISWTDMTFNPWIGCTKVSAGCINCYAERDNNRYGWIDYWGGPQGVRRKTSEANWKKPLAWNKLAEKDGIRRKVFCASLGDVFEDRDELAGWRNSLFLLVKNTPNLDWLILTKRPENAVKWGYNYLPENVWMGTTCENQEMADKRIPELMKIPSGLRFVSVEPMLEEINFGTWLVNRKNTELGTMPGIDWVIYGGESGPNCRPCDPEWIRDGLLQCRAAGIPAFVKQLGGWPNTRHELADFPEDLRVREFPR